MGGTAATAPATRLQAALLHWSSSIKVDSRHTPISNSFIEWRQVAAILINAVVPAPGGDDFLPWPITSAAAQTHTP